MLKLKINQEKEFTVHREHEQLLINGKEEIFDSIRLVDGRFHVLKNNQSYTVEIVSWSKQQKELVLNINGKEFRIEAQDQFDLLLAKMGINSSQAVKNDHLKAPMPGKVLEVKVKEGQSVQKGEVLLILEAMKMENVLKATHDTTVSQIKIKQGDTVEKGQLLLSFT